MNAKITERDANDIRDWVACGFAQAQVARAYGITSSNVRLILKGKIWQTVEQRKAAHEAALDAAYDENMRLLRERREAWVAMQTAAESGQISVADTWLAKVRELEARIVGFPIEG